MTVDPSTYRDWRPWGQQLYRVLEPGLARLESGKQNAGGVVSLRRFTKADLLATVDPARDGQMVFVTDLAGGGAPVFSRGGTWYSTIDGLAI